MSAYPGQDSLRTPLKVARRLGSSKSGVHNWWLQRITAIALIPLSLRGIAYRPIGAELLLRRHLLIYGLGGMVVPFVGIKLIDMMLVALHVV